MKIYNCIIVDDETLAQNLIETHLAKIPNIKIIAKCHTAMEALSFINENTIDILFLDIEMPDITGIEFLKHLDKPPYTILTTAYSEYALEAYEYNVIDYLLKPISFDRFFKATVKVLALLKESKVEKNTINNFKSDVQNYIFVKSNYKAIKIEFNSIIYIESMQKYAKFYLKDESITTLMSLTKLNDILPKNQFFRCQKSFIINLSKIKSIEGNLLIMGKTKKVPVSKTLKSTLLNLIDKNNIL